MPSIRDTDQLSDFSSPLRQRYPWRVAILGGTMLLLVAIAYLGMKYGYMSYLNGQINDRENQLDILETKISSSTQEGVFVFYSQLVNVQSLLRDHKRISHLFDIIESETLPIVYYDNMEVNVEENNLEITAVAGDFLGGLQQFYSLQQFDEIENVSVDSLDRKQDFVGFAIDIDFSPESFKYSRFIPESNNNTTNSETDSE